MKFIKEDLEKLIFIDKLSYRDIGDIYGVSGTWIRKSARKLGIILPKKAKFPEDWKPFNKGKKRIVENEEVKYINYEKQYCPICSNIIQNINNKFCSSICSSKHVKLKTLNKYKYNIENNQNIASYDNIKYLKPFLLEEQDNRCAICNNSNEWNNKHLVLVLDHIDGNANNNKRTNLRCVCPNCDSQLDTFKSKNKNSARKDGYLKNYKN